MKYLSQSSSSTYRSQESTRMYMSESKLEISVHKSTVVTYSASSVRSSSDSSFYSPSISTAEAPSLARSISSFSSSYFSSKSSLSMAYSHSDLGLSAGANMIGMNPGYASNIMLSYGANPNAVRGKESSLDLMSVGSNSSLTHIEMDFNPIEFINPKFGGTFVGEATVIEGEIKETFEKLMGETFPDDIKVSVLSVAAFRKICPMPGVVGVSYNRRQLGLMSEIFVIEGSLASVMLTVGHEIGHVLSKTLDDPALEEAKAYSFSFAWMDVIRDNDIAGLAGAFVSTLPAANGIHDKGYNLVKKLIVDGQNPFSIYRDLIVS